MRVNRQRFEDAGEAVFKDLLVIVEPMERRIVADAGLVGRVAGTISGLLEQVPDETPVRLTVEPEHVVVQAAEDGRVIAEVDLSSRLPEPVTEVYRDYSTDMLPVTMGGIASSDVRAGLQIIAEAGVVEAVNGHLDSTEAQGYLAAMGVESAPPDPMQ